MRKPGRPKKNIEDLKINLHMRVNPKTMMAIKKNADIQEMGYQTYLSNHLDEAFQETSSKRFACGHEKDGEGILVPCFGIERAEFEACATVDVCDKCASAIANFFILNKKSKIKRILKSIDDVVGLSTLMNAIQGSNQIIP